MSQHRIDLVGSDNNETANFIVYEENHSHDCRLTCEYRNKTITVNGGDFFEALCKIRLELEKENLLLRCYGASLNVYPSGMCRDMGRGLKAYKMFPGKQGKADNLVRIFDVGDDITPSTVDAQKEFFWNWVKSERK
jgi:hypothetical protein